MNSCLVLGLPGSGNHLLMRLLFLLGIKAPSPGTGVAVPPKVRFY